MHLTSDDPSRYDDWGEPIADRQPLSLLARGAVLFAAIAFFAGPFRWLPVISWFDPMAGTAADRLLNVTSFLAVFPAAVAGYSTILTARRDSLDRMAAWIALLLFLFSCYCWYGVLEHQLSDVLPAVGMLVIGIHIVLHLVALAAQSRAGSYIAGGLFVGVLLLAVFPPYLEEGQVEARRNTISRHLRELGTNVQVIDHAGHRDPTSVIDIDDYHGGSTAETLIIERMEASPSRQPR